MAFLDLFKSDTDWTRDEVTSLTSMMIAQSYLDNEQTDDERDLILTAITGFCPEANVEDIIKDSASLTPEYCIKCLVNMHTTKRKIVIAILMAIGMVDGDFDDDEQLMTYAVGKALNVKF